MSLRLLPAGQHLASPNANPSADISPGYENNNPLKLRGNDNLSFGFASDDESDDSSAVRGRELSNSLLQGEEASTSLAPKYCLLESNSPPLVLNEKEQAQLKKFLSKFVRDVTSEAGIEVSMLDGQSVLPTIMRMDKNLTKLRFDVYTEGPSTAFTDTRCISPCGTFIDSFLFVLREIQEIILDDTLAEMCPELVRRDMVKNAFEILNNQGRKMTIICGSEREKRQYVSAIALFRIAPRGGSQSDGQDLGEAGYFMNNSSYAGQDDGCSSASCRVQANIRKVLAQQEEEQRLDKLNSSRRQSEKIFREDRKAFSWVSNDTSSGNKEDNIGREHEGSWTARDSTKDSSGRKHLDDTGCIDYHTFNVLNDRSQSFRSNKVKSINSMRNASRTSVRQVYALPTTPTFHALSNKPQGTGLGLKGPSDDATTSSNFPRENSPFRQISCCNDPCRGCNKDQATVHPADIVPLPSPGFSIPILPDSDGGATPLVQSIDADYYFHRAVSGAAQTGQFEQTVMFGRSAPSTSTRYLSSPLHYPPSTSSVSSPKTLIGELMRSSFGHENNEPADSQKDLYSLEGRKTVIPIYGGDDELSYYNYHRTTFAAPGFLPPVSPFNSNAPYNFQYDINGYVKVRGRGERRTPQPFHIPVIQEHDDEKENDDDTNIDDNSQYEGVYTDETVEGEAPPEMDNIPPQGLPAMALIRNRRVSSSYSSESSHTTVSITAERDDQLAPLPSPKRDFSHHGDSPMRTQSPEERTPCATRLQSVESVRPEKLSSLIEPATPYGVTQHLGLTPDDFTPTNGGGERGDPKCIERSFSEFFHQEDLTNTTWEPHVTNRENTLTLLNGEDQASDSCVKDLHRQQAMKMLQNDDNFSISPSQLAGSGIEIDVKKQHQRQADRKQELLGRTSILGPGVQANSSLLENKPWQKSLDSMSPLEKLRKAAKYGTPTPFTQIQYKRLEEETSVTNMSTGWARHDR